MSIYGAGFKGEPVLNFEPPIWAPANYTLTVVSESELKLDLVDGSTWNKLPGALMVKGINVGDGDVSRDYTEKCFTICRRRRCQGTKLFSCFSCAILESWL